MTAIHRFVEQAGRGELARVVAQVASGEPAEQRRQPVWLHDWTGASPFDASLHGELLAGLRRRLA